MEMAKFILCYVKDSWAYFTTQKLSDQWGDDWNDAPYEHNAELPYEYNERDKKEGLVPWEIIKVAFDGEFFKPCSNTSNSPWSVEQINAGNIPWLRTPKWFQGSPVFIWAGTTIEDFCKLVHAGNGEVYLPMEHTG